MRGPGSARPKPRERVGADHERGRCRVCQRSYGHGFEYDDAHGPSYSHPGSCVIPAALAIGEELGASLQEVIVAMVAGYEVYARIGLLAAPNCCSAVITRTPRCPISARRPWRQAARLRRRDDAARAGNRAESRVGHDGIHVDRRLHQTHSCGHRHAQRDGGGRHGTSGHLWPRAFLSGNKGFFRTFLQRSAGENAERRFDVDRPFEIGTVWLKAYCACYCTRTSTRCGHSRRAETRSPTSI